MKIFQIFAVISRHFCDVFQIRSFPAKVLKDLQILIFICIFSSVYLKTEPDIQFLSTNYTFPIYQFKIDIWKYVFLASTQEWPHFNDTKHKMDKCELLFSCSVSLFCGLPLEHSNMETKWGGMCFCSFDSFSKHFKPEKPVTYAFSDWISNINLLWNIQCPANGHKNSWNWSDSFSWVVRPCS